MKDNRVELLRACVRPIAVIYSVIALSILAFMSMSGATMPTEGVGANCVNALIAISGTITVEYSLERGVRHYLDRKK